MEQHISLFLDLDGTLVELIDDPKSVIADTELRRLLMAVHVRLDGRLAVVSGRSLAQLDHILGTIAADLMLVGSHGAEFRHHNVSFAPPRPDALHHATEEMRRFAQLHGGLLLEEKSFGVALHYRAFPAVAALARDFADRIAAHYDLYVQWGHDMVELRPAGHDKGQAIRKLMQISPLNMARPVFIGDDVTDEAGFAAVDDLQGYGVLVGAPRPSVARYRLDAPSDVRNWLKELCR